MQQDVTFMKRWAHDPFLMKREEETPRSCGCYWAYLLMITDPYRVVSEEAQLGRVVMDLTKMRAPFQSEWKGSCSIVSKQKKWYVWIHMLWWVYVRTCVLSFPACRVDIYHFCDSLPLPSNYKAFGWVVQNLHFKQATRATTICQQRGFIAQNAPRGTLSPQSGCCLK